ncbi:hypothetical protein [Aeromonas veronii]|uniref:hypothetical protein n=1 Tax=Aeromonas veronii TaxID=654 RepID=UPI003B9FF9BE
MSVNVVKVRPTVTTDGDVIFNPNSITAPSSCYPLKWTQDITEILIRGSQEEILRTLESLKNSACSIQIPENHFSLFTYFDHDEYAKGGRSFELTLYIGFGYLVTTNGNGKGFYIGSAGIAEAILNHATNTMKDYVLGQVSDVVDAVHTVYEQLKSKAPTDKQEGELVFVISANFNNDLFTGERFTYESGKVTEDSPPDGITFIDDGYGGVEAINISFKNLFAGCVA